VRESGLPVASQEWKGEGTADKLHGQIYKVDTKNVPRTSLCPETGYFVVFLNESYKIPEE
jgi:hypothetical protein